MYKKIISFIITICITVGIFSVPLTVSSKSVYEGKISIDKVSAVTGDTVIVPVRISNNPGLMATTISITYDSAALELNYYYKGDILRDYTVVPHPDKNIIRFINCESADKTSDGVLVNLQFKVNDNAEVGLHELSIQYNEGDFCNWELDKIMPEIISGGIEVAFNGNNCSHKSYYDWTVAAEPTCKDNGAEQRICKTCGHIEVRELEPFGHKYSDKWTVDRPATANQDGIMTKYCIWCDDYVDRITFSLQQTEDGGIKNQANAENSNSSFIENIFKEQNPGKELTQNKPLENNENNIGNSSDNKLSDSSDNSIQDSDNAIDKVMGSASEDQKETPKALLEFLSILSEYFPNIETLLNIFKIPFAILIFMVI